MAPGSTLYTDGLKSFTGLQEAGFKHVPWNQPLRIDLSKGAKSVVPLADRAIGNLQQWLIGTYHGGAGEARAKPTSDLDIQEWICKRYGFVPHPFWIAHCKELYLGMPMPPEGHPPWHECPPQGRAAIREAFLHFATNNVQEKRPHRRR